MPEREYVQLIPLPELQALAAFLRGTYAARGFDGGAAECAAAWARVLEAARRDDGGGWHDGLPPAAIDDARLRALGAAIDAHFFGGSLRALLSRGGGPGMTYRAVDVARGGGTDWVSLFDASANALVVNRGTWAARRVAPDAPFCCEGAVCRSRLEALAHTVGHELVHAVVANAFPAIDASSPGYLPARRHGPIFLLLNRRLFGHASDGSSDGPIASGGRGWRGAG